MSSKMYRVQLCISVKFFLDNSTRLKATETETNIMIKSRQDFNFKTFYYY